MTGEKLAVDLRTLPALLTRQADLDPDRALVVDDRGAWARGAALEKALSMSAAFGRFGVEPGETVAIMLENRREFVASWFGLAFRGAVEVPINPTERGDRLVHILNHCGCSTLIVQGEFLEQVEQVAGRLSQLKKLIVVGDRVSESFQTTPFEELETGTVRADPAEVRFSDPAAVMYTSGTTGPAKGVVLSHGQQYINGYQPTSLFGIGPEDRIFTCLPLFHNMAQGYAVWVGLVSGASVRIAERFDADTFWSEIRAEGATVLSFVGAMLVLLAKRSPLDDDADNPLRVGYGVPVPRDLHEPFEQRFGLRLVHCYGSTEATIVTWSNRERPTPGAAGEPLADYDVRIMDEDDQQLPTGEIGQICIRPQEPFSMFSGYLGEPQKTVEAWRNLWFHTGDRGRFDERGDLWFVDRIGDVVRRMGEFISSYEVEQVLLAHPAVKLAAAYGVPSELVEEELMVALTVQPGQTLDPGEVRDWCADRLPRHGVPRFVQLDDELPMTPTGKIEKFTLRRRGVTSTTDDSRTGRKVLG